MICAVCWEPVIHDGPRGFVHHDGARVAEDGHDAVPIHASGE